MYGNIGRSAYQCIYVGSLLLALAAPGCASCARHVAELADAVRIKRDEHHDLAQIRHDVRDELADQREEVRRANAEREVAQAKLMAERAKMEAEFCQANQATELENLRSNTDESVRSKMALNVNYGFKIEDSSVDVPALKEAIKKAEDAQKENLKNSPVKKPCISCEKVCGCPGGRIKRLCPLCRHKPCEADCGGPEALKRAEELPLKSMPITSIPINIKAQLQLQVGNPTVEELRIVRKAPPKTPCDCPTCTTGGSCTKPVGGVADYDLDPNAPIIPQIPKTDHSHPVAELVKVAEAKKGQLTEPPLPDDVKPSPSIKQ